MINQILKDRYQIKSLLSKKTGRRTFLGEDLENHSLVVIKVLLFNPDFVWDDLKLFEREVAVLKSLNHSAIPNYLDSFEVDTDNGKGFALVQTYIEARSLQEWVESGRTFSELEIKAIARELLHILDYLHHRQPAVIHRDLKPSNILLADRSGNSPGHIYLVDFGSVQTVKSSGTMTIVGTYGYMPPEQFGGETQPGSDLYAGQIEIEVDRHRIVLSKKILGLKIGVDRTALKSHISSIEIAPIATDKKMRFTYEVNASDNFQLNVWDGVHKLEIAQNGRLSYPELDWLAQEIVTQLDLPLALPASSRIRQATR